MNAEVSRANLMKPIAYSYVRFSSPEQLKGDSLRRQLQLSEEYAKEHDLEIDMTLTLQDLGLSAFDGSNREKGALGAFLKAISSGKINKGSYLLVESLDRLSRESVMDALNLFSEITGSGITIVTLSDRMTYSKESIAANWTQLIVSLSIMARAHEESSIKSKRLTAVWKEKKSNAAEKIVTSAVPAWLTVKDGKIEIIISKAESVCNIFQMIRNGYGLNLLERKFNSEGIPVIGKATRWHRSYLIKMVRNRAVIGEYQPMTGKGKNRKPSGDPVKEYFPRLMTDQEFYATQQAIADRTNKGGRKGSGIANIFSGLCKCGYCGGPVRYVNKNSATNWQYLVCSNAKSGLGCKHVPWNYHELENSVLSKLAGLDISSILDDKLAERSRDELQAEHAKLTETKKRIDSLIRVAEQIGEDQEITSISKRIVELKHNESSILNSIKTLEANAQLPKLGQKHFEQFQILRKALDSTSGADLIALRLRVSHELKRFLKELKIYPDGADPWSFSMKTIGIKNGKDGRFIVAIFRTGEGRIFHGNNSMGTIWPGTKTPEGEIRAEKPLPFI